MQRDVIAGPAADRPARHDRACRGRSGVVRARHPMFPDEVPLRLDRRVELPAVDHLSGLKEQPADERNRRFEAEKRGNSAFYDPEFG